MNVSKRGKLQALMNLPSLATKRGHLELDFRVRFVRRVYSAYICNYFQKSVTEFYQNFKITSNT